MFKYEKAHSLPPTINEFVFKVASRCNINCSYCYVYNMGDEGYSSQPRFMDISTVRISAARILKYLSDRSSTECRIYFHGGEPLLLGKERFKEIIDECKLIFSNNRNINVTYHVQTNATLVSDEWVDFFIQNEVYVGISLDGDRSSHDSRRVDHNMNGTFDYAMRGLNKLKNVEYSKNILGGALSVIDISADAKKYYEFVKSLALPNFDILLPLRPWRLYLEQNQGIYGKWIAELFDNWYMDVSPPNIRFFNHLLMLLLGAEMTGSEQFGNNSLRLAIIETNGDIEAPDTLKACASNMTHLGLNVFDNEISELDDSEYFAYIRNSHAQPSSQCEDCKILKICGGGRIVDRFSKENGFDNRSTYCVDYKYLVNHVISVITDISDPAVKRILQQRVNSYREA